MRINNNLMAMNTHRQLGMTTTASSKSTEKLSSGFRINRAGDDAAGLSISEKMRGQIRGLSQASRNSQDGISLIQTAEGALTETHAILQRMRELAVQAANDTNVGDDRTEIQNEIDQLIEEIDRIGNNTEFNTQKLLNGGVGQTTGTGETEEGGTAGEATAPVLTGADVSAQFDQDLATIAALTINGQAVTLSDVSALDGSGTAFDIDDLVTALQADLDVEFDGTNHGGVTFTVSNDGDALVITSSETGSDASIEITANAASATLGLTTDATTDASVSGQDASEEAGEGSTAGGAIDVSTHEKASASIETIDAAIKEVSAQRSKLGAWQNRLEHTIKNLDTSSENLQAAESRIRDVDMAKEMMEFTKNNILQQAAQAMLAQANQAPQGVLQLLR